MEVESAEAWHGPHDFGEHAEGYHHLKVGLIATQLAEERLVFQPFGLQDGDVLRQGILLDRTLLQDIVVTTYGLVWHSDYGYYLTSVLYKTAKGLDSEVGSSHEYDAKRHGQMKNEKLKIKNERTLSNSPFARPLGRLRTRPWTLA